MSTSNKSEPAEVLSLKLRPRTFADCLGQKLVVDSILERVKTTMPRAWMFYGPSGGGKTSIARILSLSLQLPPENFGKPDAAAWADYHNFQITEFNASELNKVDDIADIVKQSRYAPNIMSKYRVIILDEAQRITTHAQNLLLKPFEDGAKSTIWIICTTEPMKILDTLRRRCVMYRVRPLSEQDKGRLLVTARKELGKPDVKIKPFLEHAEKLGISAAGKLLSAFEKYAYGETPQAALDAAIGVEADYLRLCQQFVGGHIKPLFQALSHPSFEAENGREFMMVLMGYLRKVVTDLGSPIGQAAAETILKLSAPPPYEGAAFLAWLSANLRLEIKKYARK